MKPNLDELGGLYSATLEEYLLRGTEAALHRSYELGRQALTEGLGVLEMIALHQRAMGKILLEMATPEKSVEAVQKGGEFLAEGMSSFEMTHRAFGEANAALRRVNEALEQEAKRIAHTLHDEAGQLLAAVHMTLNEVACELPSEGSGRLQGVRELLDQIEEQLRHLSHELRPTILDDLGLVPALEFLAEGVSRRTGLRIAVEGGNGNRLPEVIETALYRVVQEALNNVSKHARATRVQIRVWRTDKLIRCSVSDDGRGFEAASMLSGPDRRGLGLLGIYERLNALGGAVEIDSAPGRGTALQIQIPMED